MTKKGSAITIVILVVIIAMYIISPYVSAYSLYKAVRQGDAERVAKRIDFASFRESLKQELNGMLMKEIASDSELTENPFGGLAVALMPKFVEAMIDAYVTPAGLTALMEGKPMDPDAGQGSEPGMSADGKGVSLRDVKYAFFVNPTTFMVDVSEMKLYFRIRDWG